MRLLVITNLYPRPDEPQRGMFNFNLIEALANLIGQSAENNAAVKVICLVPEWRIWRWKTIRQWQMRSKAESGENIAPAPVVKYLPVFYLPVIGRNLSWRTYRAALSGIREHVGDSDVILSTWLYPDCVAAASLAAELNKPIWFKTHGSDRFHLEHTRRRGRILQACDIAQGIFCNCTHTAEELSRRGINRDKRHIVAHGIDCALFRHRPREESAAKLGLKPDEKTILFIGNLQTVKGPDRAIRAFASAINSSQIRPAGKLRLVIAGDGPLKSRINAFAVSAGIGDRVALIGSRPQAEIAEWMNAADCLCVPSRSEGMPNVVLEALAAGLPVVATDVGGITQHVRSQVNGIIISQRSNENRIISELALALSAALDRDWNREMISIEGRTRTWERAAAETLAVMAAGSRR